MSNFLNANTETNNSKYIHNKLKYFLCNWLPSILKRNVDEGGVNRVTLHLFVM